MILNSSHGCHMENWQLTELWTILESEYLAFPWTAHSHTISTLRGHPYPVVENLEHYLDSANLVASVGSWITAPY